MTLSPMLNLHAAQLRAGLSDLQFDQLVLQVHGGSVARVRRILSAQLAAHVQEAVRVCELDEDQEAMLRLAGQGDVSRFFEKFNAAKVECRRMNVERLNQDVLKLIQPLQQQLAVGIYHEHSLLFKCLRNILTSEQLAEYEAAVQKRKAYRARAKVTLVVAMIEEVVPLDDEQRENLIDLMVPKLTFDNVSTLFEDYQRIIQTMSRMPKEELQPLFDETQWEVLHAMMFQARFIAPAPAVFRLR